MSAALRLWFPLVAPVLAFAIEGFFGWWAGARICAAASVGSGRAQVAENIERT